MVVRSCGSLPCEGGLEHFRPGRLRSGHGAAADVGVGVRVSDDDPTSPSDYLLAVSDLLCDAMDLLDALQGVDGDARDSPSNVVRSHG